jgi:hypothetical protein
MSDQFNDHGDHRPDAPPPGEWPRLVDGGRHWDCDLRAPSAALYTRLGRGLLFFGGKVEDSRVLPNRQAVIQAPREAYVTIRLWLPEGQAEAFAAYVGVELKAPPRAHL